MDNLSQLLNNYKDGVPVNVNVQPKSILLLSASVITVASLIILLKHLLS